MKGAFILIPLWDSPIGNDLSPLFHWGPKSPVFKITNKNKMDIHQYNKEADDIDEIQAEERMKLKRYNCGEPTNSTDGYCECCGHMMFGPNRNEVQPSKFNSQTVEDVLMTQKLEDWFVMLNSPDFDDNDAGMVREEIKQQLLESYGRRLGTNFIQEVKE